MPDIKYLEDRIGVYCERWKPEHDAVMDCYELEDALVRGIWFYEALTKLERQWHKSVDEGLHVSNQDEVDRLNRLWDSWHEACDPATTSISRFEQQGYEVDGAKEFLAISTAARERVPVKLPDWQIAVQSQDGKLFGRPARTENDLRQMSDPFPG